LEESRSESVASALHISVADVTNHHCSRNGRPLFNLMSDNTHFDDRALDLLEQRLWRLIKSHSFAKEDPPPHISILLEPDACEEYSEALDAYAWTLAHGKSDGWDDHPLLEHLTLCDVCQQHLDKMVDFYTQAPRVRPRNERDIDITLLYKHLPQKYAGDARSSGDVSKPVLLDAGILDQPAGWYYSLEQIRRGENEPNGILLTLINPDGDAADISVRMVLLGRILHGTTDEKGQLFFEEIEAPLLDQPLVPAINLHLNFPA